MLLVCCTTPISWPTRLGESSRSTWHRAPTPGPLEAHDNPWELIVPWLEATHDLGAITQACPRIHVLISSNDPYTSDHAGNAAHWRERLGAEVNVVEDARHFNASEEPLVLAAVQSWLGEPQNSKRT